MPFNKIVFTVALFSLVSNFLTAQMKSVKTENGLVAGGRHAEMNIFKGLSGGLRYYYGLSNAFKRTDISGNRAVQLYAAYKLF